MDGEENQTRIIIVLIVGILVAVALNIYIRA